MKDPVECRYCSERFSNEYFRNVHEAEYCSVRNGGERGGEG